MKRRMNRKGSGPVVVALNPSVDVEWRMDRVRPEEKNIIGEQRRWPGGKGVNVARWLHHLGVPATLLIPLGQAPGQELRRGLRAWGLRLRAVSLREASRVNVIVTPDAGPQLRFNEGGPRLSQAEWRAVRQALELLLAGCPLLILSGSLPRGLKDTAYAALIRQAHRQRVPVMLDCEGASLAAALDARPLLVKPNEHELAQWAGRPLRTDREFLQAADRLSEATRGWVFLSRGSRGALLIHAREGRRFQARAPRVEVVNTVGAGDALLSAVAASWVRGDDTEDWIRWGVATGSAMTACRAGQLPSVRTVAGYARQVRVEAPGIGPLLATPRRGP